MPYDEDSFLQGITVGRAMKGVTVLNPSGRGIFRVISERINLGTIEHYSAEVPPGEGGSVSISYMSISISGKEINAAAVVPDQMGITSLTAGNFDITLNPIYNVTPSEPPHTMGGTVSAEAIITIDE